MIAANSQESRPNFVALYNSRRLDEVRIRVTMDGSKIPPDMQVCVYPMNHEYSLTLCTCPDRQSAESIASSLVDQGIAACVNIVPGLRSIYTWQGKRESADELLLIIKSRPSCYPELERCILSTHPYELPEIISVPICTGLPAYLNWIGEATRSKK